MKPIPAAVFVVLIAGAIPAQALDLPTRKPGFWEMKMTMSGGQTVTMSQCTDESTDKDMVAMSNPMAKDMCSKNETRKTATGWSGDAVCKIGSMTTTSHSEITGDFNAAYQVKVTSTNQGAPAGMPATSDMTMNATWAGPCKPGQKPGDIMMPGGMKMNIKDMQALKDLVPKR